MTALATLEAPRAAPLFRGCYARPRMARDPVGGPEGGHEEPVGEATQLLRAVAAGQADRHGELLSLVYAELHRLAGRAMKGENPQHTLQPTALVHEAWLKLFDGEAVDFQDRKHLLAVSARAMRQILVDHARGRKRAKRGGGWARAEVPLEDTPGSPADEEFDLVALHTALEELEREAPRPAKVVELRYFGGFSVEDTALALDTSESTVAREWRFARAWLSKRLESS